MKSFSCLIHRKFAALLARVLPTRVKRLVLLPALYSTLTNQCGQVVTQETLEKLQAAMHITSIGNEEAMGLPMTLSHLLWDGEVVDLACSKWLAGNVEDSVSQLETAIPVSLRYPQMVEDIRALLRILPDVTSTHSPVH